ncbi:MAG: hydrogenase iron-sulfur subunit, partial [Dehalococcoidia bacterium]
VWIVPVLCVAKLEANHVLRAFEAGAEGVFIAGCGEQCSRENTAYWVRQRVAKVGSTLEQIGLERERVQAFVLGDSSDDLVNELDRFTDQIGALYLTSVILEEVKS